MKPGNRDIRTALIKTTNSIKKKFREFHKNKQLTQENLKEFYKPVLKSIHDLQSADKGSSNLVEKNVAQKNRNHSEIISSTPKAKKSVLFRDEDSYESDNDNYYDNHNYYRENDRKNEEKTEGKSLLTDDTSHMSENMTFYTSAETSPHMKQYLSKVYQSSSPKFDSIYGIQKNGNDYKIGNTDVKFDGDGDIVIQNRKYEYSKGLYDLLFYAKPPPGYTKQDLANYKRILDDTNVHKSNYQPGNSVRANNSYKYSKIIKSLYKRGTGLDDHLKLDEKTTNYTYWDDPNELVNRLRLLISSKTAGHTGHENEIISIIEELREAKIIL